MSSNDTNLTLAKGPFDPTFNLTANSTRNSTQNDSQPFTVAKLLRPEFLLLEAKVVLSALTIIWLAAHASLRRPPSAAPAKVKDGKKRPKDDQFTEGFAASDAIMLPVMAGTFLIGLYYLIEYLQDPDILNKVMRIYLSTVSIASIGRLAGDALNILTSLIFPNLWADRFGDVYHVDAEKRRQVKVDPNGTETEVPIKSPFPSFLAVIPLSDHLVEAAWEIRHLFIEEWTVRFAVHGLVFVKFNLRLNSLLGIFVAILVSIAYHLTGWHIISNLLGSALTYSAFSFLSPTSFAIGTMVLAGLFIYDIVMVFYTPFMITVAKKIDAPIKLVFQGSHGVSLLGLGDIIVPGLLMGLALRFDLYRHYQKKIKLEPVDLTSEIGTTKSGETITTVETQRRRVKAPYIDPQGQWGNRFWTTKFGRLLPVSNASSVRDATAFPKPYFYAAITGYVVGMLATLTVMVVFEHGQPALLYLVPGVTGSLWLTALVRGELKDFWEYTEDGSLDTEDVVVEVDASGQVVETRLPVGEKNQGEKGGEKKAGKEDEKDPDASKTKRENGDYEVFLFSITAPRHRAPKRD